MLFPLDWRKFLPRLHQSGILLCIELTWQTRASQAKLLRDNVQGFTRDTLWLALAKKQKGNILCVAGNKYEDVIRFKSVVGLFSRLFMNNIKRWTKVFFSFGRLLRHRAVRTNLAWPFAFSSRFYDHSRLVACDWSRDNFASSFFSTATLYWKCGRNSSILFIYSFVPLLLPFLFGCAFTHSFRCRAGKGQRKRAGELIVIFYILYGETESFSFRFP